MNTLLFFFQSNSERQSPEESQAIQKENLVNISTAVVIKIAQIMGRHLNKQRPVLKRLVY